MSSSASVHTTATVGPGVGRVWFYGRTLDLLLGAGVGYLISIPVLVMASSLTGAAGWPVFVGALIALLVSGPHYGATILRVYEHRADRRHYAFFSILATAVLCGLFVVGPTHGAGCMGQMIADRSGAKYFYLVHIK